MLNEKTTSFNIKLFCNKTKRKLTNEIFRLSVVMKDYTGFNLAYIYLRDS